MKKAYEEGKKVQFTRGKLLVGGRVVPVTKNLYLVSDLARSTSS